MKFVIVFVTVLFAIVFLFLNTKNKNKESGIEQNSHIYSTWDTMEFDKCISVWLITNFLDKDAEFVILPQGTEDMPGQSFDVPGSKWSRQHRKCTSDCIAEELKINDPKILELVEMAHNIELNFWQLDSFPKAKLQFEQVTKIIESSSDFNDCFKQTNRYFTQYLKGEKTQ